MGVSRWPLAVDRWPNKKAVGGWPLLWPDTYLRRLNQTNEKKHSQSEVFCFDHFLVGLVQCP
jgi:hypothetical protein